MICYCCTAQGMHMHLWTMPCRGNDENRHAQLQSTRLTLTVLRASGQTASSHLTRIKFNHTARARAAMYTWHAEIVG